MKTTDAIAMPPDHVHVHVAVDVFDLLPKQGQLHYAFEGSLLIHFLLLDDVCVYAVQWLRLFLTLVA